MRGVAAHLTLLGKPGLGGSQSLLSRPVQLLERGDLHLHHPHLQGPATCAFMTTNLSGEDFGGRASARLAWHANSFEHRGWLHVSFVQATAEISHRPALSGSGWCTQALCGPSQRSLPSGHEREQQGTGASTLPKQQGKGNPDLSLDSFQVPIGI